MGLYQLSVVRGCRGEFDNIVNICGKLVCVQTPVLTRLARSDLVNRTAATPLPLAEALDEIRKPAVGNSRVEHYKQTCLAR